MFRTYDLHCAACDEVEHDVLVEFEAGTEPVLPPCECGGPRTRRPHAPRVKVFHPVYHEGVGLIQNSDDLKVARHAVAKAQGCKPEDIVIEHEPRQDVKRRAEEIKHRRWARDKKNGLDTQQVTEIRKTARKHGLNPLTNKQGRKSLKEQ